MQFFNLSRKHLQRLPESSNYEDDITDAEGLLSDREKEGTAVIDKTSYVKQSRCTLKWVLWLLVALMLLIAILLAIGLNEMVDDDACFKHATYYSPLTRDIDTRPRLVTTNGTLDYPSIYRGPPSPEIDDNWNHISYNMGIFSLPEKEALKAGLQKGDVRIPAGYQGSGEYMASLELTHQLHCVNFLRKAAWINYPYYHDKGYEFRDPPHELESHLYHCIEILRQAIMCNADPGIIGYRFVRDRESRPYPDFNTPHKCRDYQGMLDWAYARTVQGHPEEQLFVPGPDELVWDHAP